MSFGGVIIWGGIVWGCYLREGLYWLQMRFHQPMNPYLTNKIDNLSMKNANILCSGNFTFLTVANTTKFAPPWKGRRYFHHKQRRWSTRGHCHLLQLHLVRILSIDGNTAFLWVHSLNGLAQGCQRRGFGSFGKHPKFGRQNQNFVNMKTSSQP